MRDGPRLARTARRHLSAMIPIALDTPGARGEDIAPDEQPTTLETRLRAQSPRHVARPLPDETPP